MLSEIVDGVVIEEDPNYITIVQQHDNQHYTMEFYDKHLCPGYLVVRNLHSVLIKLLDRKGQTVKRLLTKKLVIEASPHLPEILLKGQP